MTWGFRVGALQSGVGHTAGVTEPEVSRQHLGASTDGAGDDGLVNDTLLNGLYNAIFFHATAFAKEDQHLARKRVDKGGSEVDHHQ